jgi:hypothetical protein
VIRWVLAAAALLLAVPAAAGEIHADVQHMSGDAVAGGTVQLRIHLDWEGRADAFTPSTPKLPVAKGGTIALGRAASTFDGTKTTWSTVATVHLPERGERWQIGPGEVVVRPRGGGKETVVLPELVLGGPNFNPLLGQGAGSAFVILLVVGWFRMRDKQLAREEQEAPPFAERVAAAQAAMGADPWSAAAAIEALLALKLDLEGAGVDNAAPATDEMQARLEGLRYGGEEIDVQTCSDWLAALETAADGGRG